MKKLEDYEIMPIFPGQPVSDPQISPDGDKVLFTYTSTNIKENKRDSHIWLLLLKDGKPRQFTHGKGNDVNPRWSHDGREILFLSDRARDETGDGKKEEKKEGKMQLWVIPADGGEAKQITSLEGGAKDPVSSPDGKEVFFISDVFKGEGKKDDEVKIIRRIRYRFDGQGYLPGIWRHIFSVALKGGDARQLTDGEFEVESFALSPDGERVAFISSIDEHADISFFRNIYVIPSSGGEPELLWESESARIGLRRASLEWSPDGKYLAFDARVIDNVSNVGYKNDDIWIIPVDGGEPKNLTADLDRTVSIYGGALKWSPDSKFIYFKIPDEGSIQLCRVSLEGEVEQVIQGKIQVGGFSLDRLGSKIAFTATDSMTPFELWISLGKEIKPVTEMSKELLEKLRLSEPEEFWFTSSDGSRIQGWIHKPINFEEGEKYPMVLTIHGGPASAYGYSLTSPDFHVLADQGYAVAYVNPTGSVRFGEAFAAGVSGHWGERDYEDIMEAVDYIQKTYSFIDPGRLGVMGVSYGGYMTNWIVGHTDRFKAAVALNSMSNLYSGTGTSDIDYMDHSVTAGKNPWEDVKYFMEKSPISYIENITTPLLLIHSEQDYRCPIDNAEQLFTGLKKLRRTVEFVRFPGSHGFGRMGKPKHRVERLQHIVRWFDRYLR